MQRCRLHSAFLQFFTEKIHPRFHNGGEVAAFFVRDKQGLFGQGGIRCIKIKPLDGIGEPHEGIGYKGKADAFFGKGDGGAHLAGCGLFIGALLAYSYLFHFNPVWWLCGFILLTGAQGTARISYHQHTLWEVILGFVAGMFCGIVGILFI